MSVAVLVECLGFHFMEKRCQASCHLTPFGMQFSDDLTAPKFGSDKS